MLVAEITTPVDPVSITADTTAPSTPMRRCGTSVSGLPAVGALRNSRKVPVWGSWASLCPTADTAPPIVSTSSACRQVTELPGILVMIATVAGIRNPRNDGVMHPSNPVRRLESRDDPDRVQPPHKGWPYQKDDDRCGENTTHYTTRFLVFWVVVFLFCVVCGSLVLCLLVLF